MTNQVQGELLFAGWSGTASGDWAYTPWMPSRADTATFGVEVTAVNGVTLTWGVQTRSLESTTTDECLTGTLPTIGVVGTSVQTNDTPAKELVRYKFKTAGSAGTATWVVVRALPPTWARDR